MKKKSGNALPTAKQLLAYFELHLHQIILSPESAKRRLNREVYSLDFGEWYRDYYLSSRHWGELRLLKLATSPVCEKCKAGESILHVHHVNYRHIYDVQLGDLRVLCGLCHDRAHRKR